MFQNISLDQNQNADIVDQPIPKHKLCKIRMRAFRDARAYATAPLVGKHARKGQYGAFVLRRGKFVFGDVPYSLMKAASRFSALEINLRNAYKTMGEPVYGVHVCNRKGRAIVVRDIETPNVVSIYPWRTIENKVDFTEMFRADVVLAVIDAYQGICVNIQGLGVGFCLKEERTVYGLLPVEIIRQSTDPTKCMKYLMNGYGYLENFGSLYYGWLVSYLDEDTEIEHKAFVALENTLEDPTPRMVVYRSSANFNEKLKRKCWQVIDEKSARHRHPSKQLQEC